MKSLFLSIFLMFSVALSHAAVVTQSELTVSTSVLALAANSSRTYLLIQNKGTSDILVKFDTAHSELEGIKIPSGGNWETIKAPNNAIYLKSAAGSNAVTIIHGSY